jgi:Ca2+-binding RTX toxin-like protein
MSSNKAGRYSMLTTPVPGTTGTGLDQLVDAVFADTGLAGTNMAPELLGGAGAANGLNQIILEAAAATGAAADSLFTATEVIAMNAWIREHRLTEWTGLHGDDEGGEETGFHLIQNDGGNLQHRGQALFDTVADGIYHLGFEIRDNRFLNEDGDANASVDQVAAWLTQFYTDHSRTGSGLDRITNLIMADAGLPMKTPEADIGGGADAANSLNQLIMDGLAAVGALGDGKVSTADVIAVNAWIRADATRLARFIELHGDDENGSETGYHLVQNDGATTKFFGKNLVNTVADGVYHIGFQIVDGRFRNEDGDANATVSDVADWLNYFLSDASSTGTGLDRIVDTIKVDAGLARNTPAADIDGGAGAANALNALILEGIAATGAMADGWITSADLEAINAWLRADPLRLARFIELHGDDENGSETGYHLVQNDGATTNYFGQNLVNTVADGIYHFGFTIENGRFLNEDGDANATLANVASWLNYFIKGSTLVVGADAASLLTGTEGADQIVGQWNADTVQAGDGDDLINAGYGNDLINGGGGNDLIFGEGGNDTMDGGNGSDTYQVTGNQAGGWSSFAGFDTYADTGAAGSDRIVATGADVDIGLRSFSATNGIEVIDASGATGTTRLLGDSSNDTLDLRGVTLAGNIVIDGAYGNDVLYGNNADNTLRGGGGNDTMDGGNGSDTYQVTGNQAGGWSSFAGFDTYADTGAAGSDRIVATGADVDIGLRSFSATNGIEVIDASGATGTTRLLGDSSNDTLDLRGVTLAGNIVIDGAYGNDVLYGNNADNTLRGGGGNDTMDGGNGSDTYQVTGNQAGGWSSFAGFDTYADTGAAGSDRIVATGADVDIGLRSFSATNGIEVIDASGATGTTRLLGDSSNDTLDLRGVTLAGNIVIDGAYGNDVLYGNNADNTLRGGGGNDTMDGGNGSDTYQVTGNQAGGWSSFAGFDTYADTGAAGSDRIVATGADVDIGLRSFSATNGIEVIDASGATGTTRLLGDSSNDTLDLRGVTLAGNIVIDGAYGNDVLYGNNADNTLRGGGGNDTMDGGNGSDTYQVTGNQAGGWSSFAGFDTYADTGAAGSDRIVATGADVDIGLRSFSATNGIEVIDASGATGTTRLLGDSSNDTLDLRGVTLAGNIVIDGAYGNDVLYGNNADNTLRGGGGNDTMDGGNGSDTYQVTGNQAGGWSSFAGFDTYADTGAAGSDRIVATGADVDIGLRSFSATNGIEVIDASGATGTTRLLGDSSNDTLDLRGVTLAGNIVIDGAYGNDVLYGNNADNTLRGGGGNDTMDGGNGSDTYQVTGNQAGGWSSFAGFDTYADTGAAGSDRIVATGADVDIGLRSFSATNGIEVIDASGATGTTRLLGDSSNDTLDLRGVTLAGNIVIDGAYGDDRLVGGITGDVLRGGSGNDLLVGGAGQDSLDGGSGNDLLLGSQGVAGGRELYVGGAGSDRIALAHNDGSAVDIRGGSQSGTDGASDLITLVGTRGALAFLATVLDFEVGKDRIDLSQLRDAGNNVMALDDLIISTSGGNTQIGFAAGVHAVDGGSIDVQITLVGVTGVSASAFSFGAPTLPWGLATLDSALGYL